MTSQRADVVLAGTHPETGEASYVFVELNHWSAAYTLDGDPEIVEVPGTPGGPRLHPVIQVRGYCDYLLDFARVLSERPAAQRRKIGLSQEAIAAKAGIHRTYVGAIERGERNTSLLNVHNLTGALGVGAEVLLRRSAGD